MYWITRMPLEHHQDYNSLCRLATSGCHLGSLLVNTREQSKTTFGAIDEGFQLHLIPDRSPSREFRDEPRLYLYKFPIWREHRHIERQVSRLDQEHMCKTSQTGVSPINFSTRTEVPQPTLINIPVSLICPISLSTPRQTVLVSVEARKRGS